MLTRPVALHVDATERTAHVVAVAVGCGEAVARLERDVLVADLLEHRSGHLLEASETHEGEHRVRRRDDEREQQSVRDDGEHRHQVGVLQTDCERSDQQPGHEYCDEAEDDLLGRVEGLVDREAGLHGRLGLHRSSFHGKNGLSSPVVGREIQ